MQKPGQLKEPDIPKAVRGYSIPETDEYVEYLTGQYNELYKEYKKLEKRFNEVEKKAESAAKDEDSIRSALINAQKASAKITSEANEKADMIVRSAKISCDKIIDDFRKQIAIEKKKLAAVIDATGDLKEKLLEVHREQIAKIEELTSDDSYKDLLVDDDLVVDSAISQMKNDISDRIASKKPKEPKDTGKKPSARKRSSSDDGGYDGPEPLDLDKAYERRDLAAEEEMFERPDQKLFEVAKHDSELENNPAMTRKFDIV